MEDHERERIAGLVRALLSKTVANGATEEEAISAANKARELMDKYDLSVGETAMKQEGVDTSDLAMEGQYDSIFFDRVGNSLEKFTDTKIWRTTRRYPTATIHYMVILGTKADQEFAKHLFGALLEFSIAGSQVHGRATTVRRAFVMGAGERIAERLREAAAARKVKPSTTGTALVLVTKEVMVRDWLRDSGMRFGKRHAAGARDAEAYHSGRVHGNSATFNRAVE